MPTLSFVVPVYNVENQLMRCLDSLLAQSFSDFEIVAVNDGSTDRSPEILEEYASRFPDCLRIFHKVNGGLSDARNYGLERARGEYVSFVDSDDFVRQDFAEKVVQKMQSEQADLLIFDFYYYYDSGKTVPVSAAKHFSSDPVREAILAPPMAYLRVYRRNLLGKDPFLKGIYYEDLQMAAPTVLKAERVCFLSEPFYFYYQREGSIMNQSVFSEKFMDIFRVTESVYQQVSDLGKLEEYHDEIEYLFLEHLYRSAALRFCSFPKRKELFQALRRTVEAHFPHWRNNPYLKQSGFLFRTIVFLTGSGHSLVVKLLKKLKG